MSGVKDTTTSYMEQKYLEERYKLKLLQEHLYALKSRHSSVLLFRHHLKKVHVKSPQLMRVNSDTEVLHFLLLNKKS